MNRSFFSFARNQSGSTTIEFAIIAPLMALIISAVVEVSLISYTSTVMESATTISSRLGKTGFTQTSVPRQTMIYNMIKAQCGLLVDMTKVSITTLSYGTFGTIADPEPYTDSNHNGARDTGESYTDVNGNGQWDADMGVAGLGGAGDVVIYKVTYPWKVMTPIMKKFFGDGTGTFTITSSTVVKNEPYNTAVAR